METGRSSRGATPIYRAGEAGRRPDEAREAVSDGFSLPSVSKTIMKGEEIGWRRFMRGKEEAQAVLRLGST
jgi:hypothetical protein